MLDITDASHAKFDEINGISYRLIINFFPLVQMNCLCLCFYEKSSGKQHCIVAK